MVGGGRDGEVGIVCSETSTSYRNLCRFCGWESWQPGDTQVLKVVKTVCSYLVCYLEGGMYAEGFRE
jgi:hypothetical protein